MSSDNRDNITSELIFEVRAFQTAVDVMDQVASEVLGINRTDLRCLDLLGARGPLTAGQLAEAAGLSTGATTAVIDRLERAGYAERVRDEKDRRSVLVTVTDKARRRGDEVYGPLADEALSMLAKFTTRQLALLRDFMRDGKDLNSRHAARLRDRLDQGGR